MPTFMSWPRSRIAVSTPRRRIDMHTPEKGSPDFVVTMRTSPTLAASGRAGSKSRVRAPVASRVLRCWASRAGRGFLCVWRTEGSGG
ncbi:hypothetical protein CTA1_8939 [Colletotrichum tanaceti]|uniref:Uncharacterized protein n=1 Tax=Colletotrichum tanaceti TaxID=1306861 RepID=A0A4U6X8S5_9PEZI|nr:hypothetical protein CTA1_8939 [Colletotrichum tanaceti]